MKIQLHFKNRSKAQTPAQLMVTSLTSLTSSLRLSFSFLFRFVRQVQSELTNSKPTEW